LVVNSDQPISYSAKRIGPVRIGCTYLRGVDRSERNVSVDNIARIARGLKVKAWMLLLDDSAKL
jgi:hypothetical protein